MLIGMPTFRWPGERRPALSTRDGGCAEIHGCLYENSGVGEAYRWTANHRYGMVEPEDGTMPSITIHAIDPELDKRLSEEARRRKTSKNRLVKELLARSLGLPVEGRMPDDYREFCGLWTAEEYAEFAARQADNSRIDPVDWLP